MQWYECATALYIRVLVLLIFYEVCLSFHLPAYSHLMCVGWCGGALNAWIRLPNIHLVYDDMIDIQRSVKIWMRKMYGESAYPKKCAVCVQRNTYRRVCLKRFLYIIHTHSYKHPLCMRIDFSVSWTLREFCSENIHATFKAFVVFPFLAFLVFALFAYLLHCMWLCFVWRYDFSLQFHCIRRYFIVIFLA